MVAARPSPSVRRLPRVREATPAESSNVQAHRAREGGVRPADQVGLRAELFEALFCQLVEARLRLVVYGFGFHLPLPVDGPCAIFSPRRSEHKTCEEGGFAESLDGRNPGQSASANPVIAMGRSALSTALTQSHGASRRSRRSMVGTSWIV